MLGTQETTGPLATILLLLPAPLPYSAGHSQSVPLLSACLESTKPSPRRSDQVIQGKQRNGIYGLLISALLNSFLQITDYPPVSTPRQRSFSRRKLSSGCKAGTAGFGGGLLETILLHAGTTALPEVCRQHPQHSPCSSPEARAGRWAPSCAAGRHGCSYSRDVAPTSISAAGQGSPARPADARLQAHGLAISFSQRFPKQPHASVLPLWPPSPPSPTPTATLTTTKPES